MTSDQDKIEARFAVLMRRVTSGEEVDRDQLRADIAALAADIDAPGTVMPFAERAIIKEALEGFAEMLETPDVLDILADANGLSREPVPEIFEAIDAGDMAGVRAALDTWEVNARVGPYQKTALYHATSNMFGATPEMMHLLLEAGADPRLGLADSNVLHGLGFAVFRDVTPEALAGAVQRCVDLGADLEARTGHLEWTPLISAASEWNEVATEALLMCGADPTARAGSVDGVFGAGEAAAYFAAGHPETSAVLARYARRH